MTNPLLNNEVVRKVIKKFGRKKPEVKTKIRERYTCSSGKCTCKDCEECDYFLIEQIEEERDKFKRIGVL